MRSRRLQRNTSRGIGIFLASLVWLGGLPAGGAGVEDPGNDPVPVSRAFQIQFHSADINGKLWYRYLHHIGVETVIVRVFQDREDNGGLYFTNSEFRVIKPHLDRLIPSFQSQPLDLYAWMIARRFNWVDQSAYFDYSYQDGERRRVKKFDIFNPRAVRKIVAVFRELAGKTINGILIQDDFFLRHNEGFSNWGKAMFTHRTRIPANEQFMTDSRTISSEHWNRIKVDQITTVLDLIVKNCKQVNPGIKVGMNIYYETPYYHEESRSWYAHDLGKLVKTGIDHVYLMAYHRQMKKERRLTEGDNRRLFKKIVEQAWRTCGDKLVVKLQIRDWDTGRLIPLGEIQTYLDLVPGGVKRICLTPVRAGDFGYVEQIIQNQDRLSPPHRAER